LKEKEIERGADMEEVWKNYFKHFSISNFGRVRNDHTGKIRKLTKNRYGYLRTNITLAGGTHKEIKVHRAVAELFIPNPNHYSQVNHIDGDKTNNRVSNLEWTTCRGNVHHAILNNLRPQNMKR